MSANSVVRPRIDEHVKEEAAAALGAMGLTVSDAFRMLLTRVARERALPYEPWTPNEDSVASMREARAGDLERVTLEELKAVVDEKRDGPYGQGC